MSELTPPEVPQQSDGVWPPADQPQPAEWPATAEQPVPADQRIKRELKVGLFVLGFLSPALWMVPVGALDSAGVDSNISMAGALGAFLLTYVVMLLVGRQSRIDALRSFALGGLAAVVSVGLLGLLVLGSCLVLLQGASG
jgi:hypothetical protein